MTKLRYKTVFAVFLLLPCSAYANAGTPLMWVSFLHLFIGNGILGLIEGELLSRWCKVPRTRPQFAMIAANYFSAWVGGQLLWMFMHSSIDLHLYNAWRWLWAAVLAMFVATVLLEWPFIAFAVRKSGRSASSILKVNVVVQLLTYTVLCAFYLMASPMKLFTGLNVVPLGEMPLRDNATVYFISADDGHVYSIPLSGGDPTQIAALKSTNLADVLVMETNATSWIMLAENSRSANGKSSVPIKTSTNGLVTSTIVRSYWNVPTIGESNVWSYNVGFWAAVGLVVQNDETGERTKYAFETPFVQWRVRNATEVPSGQVVFQLGRDQICVFDPETRRISLLARGRGPAVVVDE